MLGFFAIFWMSFLIGFSGALVPGPVLSVTIKEAATRGPRAGPLVVIGHGLAEIGITVALILGISSLLEDARIKAIVASVGGLFLMIMGLSMLLKTRNPARLEIAHVKTDKRRTRMPILLGMTTTLSNPYWFGWWGSIGATLLVASSSLGYVGIIAFVTGHVASDLVWYTLVSFLVALGLSYSKGLWYRITFGVCGGFLVVVGILFMRYSLALAGKL